MTAMENHNQGPEPPEQKTIWDNDLPAGDSPPLPRWPLIAAVVACAVWMVFLIAMMIMRIHYTSS